MSEEPAQAPQQGVDLSTLAALDRVQTSLQVSNTKLDFLMEDRAEARDSRKGIYTRLDQLSQQHAGVHERLSALEKAHERMAGAVDVLTGERYQAIGRQNFIAKLAGLATRGRVILVAAFGAGGGAAWFTWPWLH